MNVRRLALLALAVSLSAVPIGAQDSGHRPSPGEFFVPRTTVFSSVPSLDVGHHPLSIPMPVTSPKTMAFAKGALIGASIGLLGSILAAKAWGDTDGIGVGFGLHVAAPVGGLIGGFAGLASVGERRQPDE